MNSKIELISEIIPKNNGDFALADVNVLRGGYIQVQNAYERELYITKYADRLKQGMLCYVIEETDSTHIWEYDGEKWKLWRGQGWDTLATGQKVYVTTHQTLYALQTDTSLQSIGQLAFCMETMDLRYYNGESWCTFNRIYIQESEPEDKSGIWIDTSENPGHNKSETIINSLLQTIAILQARLAKMEYAFDCQMDFGGPDNNNYHVFDDAEGEEPDLSGSEDFGGSNEDEDNLLQQANRNVALADAPEPVEYKEWVPNCRHLQIKGGTHEDIQRYKDEFAPRELIWDETYQALYIKDSKTLQLIKIGAVGQGGDPIIPDDPIIDIMEGIIQSGDKIASIEFIDLSNQSKSYKLSVKNGKIALTDSSLDTKSLLDNSQIAGAEVDGVPYYSTLYFPKDSGNSNSPCLYINMVYCGQDNTKNSYGSRTVLELELLFQIDKPDYH